MIAIIDTGRVGELRQCEALARGLGWAWEVVSPWKMPRTVPRLILSFGKALLPAMHLRKRFGPGVSHVHLGRPRCVASARIDLVIVMPQDDYPKTSNTLHLDLPLNSAELSPVRTGHTLTSRHCGNWTSLFLNGPTAHHILGYRECDHMLHLAKRVATTAKEPLQVVLSHRTPRNLELHMRKICAPSYTPVIRRDLHEALSQSNRVIVTADSASLLADALRSGRPTWLYPLQKRKTINRYLHRITCAVAPQLRMSLIEKGLIAGGTDFERWHRYLLRTEQIRLLTRQTARFPFWRGANLLKDHDLQRCVQQIHQICQTHGVSCDNNPTQTCAHRSTQRIAHDLAADVAQSFARV